LHLTRHETYLIEDPLSAAVTVAALTWHNSILVFVLRQQTIRLSLETDLGLLY
jgi:hypothetical protein